MEKEIEDERKEEWRKESVVTEFDDWYSDNKHDLIREFAKENKMLISDVETCEEEFNNYVREEFKLYKECK
jgi:hypothetical protein